MTGRRLESLLFRTFVFLSASTGLPAGVLAQGTRAVDESYFVEKAYPMLHTAQCERCHSDNGVATETQLEFPEPDVDRERITAFGLSMLDFVDRKDPEQSLLLRKPTKRIKHTGGRRIKPGSEEEAVLKAWVDYLAGLSDEQVRSAYERVARVERGGLEPLPVRRLTHAEYNRTVHDLLDDETQPAASFPKEDFINGFTNQLEGQGITPIQAEAYGKAAERLARAAFRGGDPYGLIPRKPESPTDAESADAFVRGFGLRTFRRPLSDDEAKRYTGLLLEEAARARDFQAGASLVIEAMLQSPMFLFRVERGPNSDDAPYETAARLSYFLWGTTPDDQLLRDAGEGELETVEQVEAQARRMLDDPRARGAFEEFLSQWMRLDRLLEATRDRRRFREYNADVAAAMAEETRRLFNHVVWSDLSFMEFFTAGYTFVNPALARLYGLPAPAEEFGKVDYPADSGRSGVLGHGSYLTLTSTPSETSPTARGLFIRNHFLGQEVPPPPAGVNTVLPNITEETPMTNRQRLAIHLNSESCAGCHRLLDPIGLGFEQYNAIGAFQKKMVLVFPAERGEGKPGRRSTTRELDLDSSGFIEGIEGSAFSTPRELGRLLAVSPTCHKAIVKQLFRYAFGRQETVNDKPVIDAALAKFRDSGFRFRELVVALVTSELFLQKGSG